MKKAVIILLLFSSFISCKGPLSLAKLNKAFIGDAKTLAFWEKDVIESRTEAFKLLNLNLDTIAKFYLIEEYEPASNSYYGLLYFSDNNYYYFYHKREVIDKSIINFRTVIDKRELTPTHAFIISNLNSNNINKIAEESDKSIKNPASFLYITIAKRNSKKQIELFQFSEFIIENEDDLFFEKNILHLN